MKIYYLLLTVLALSCTSQKVVKSNEGVYKVISISNDGSPPCNLSLTLKEDTYEFKGVTTAKGKYSLGNEGSEKFIIFLGLKYGETDDRYQNEDRDVSGSVLQDTIIIQNYGNSINDFITLRACDEKYIYLVRNKH